MRKFLFTAVAGLAMTCGLFMPSSEALSGLGCHGLRAHAGAGCYGARPGQIRRAERRAYRGHRKAVRRARRAAYGCHGQPVAATCSAPAAPATCSGQ